jgi:tetratricopeptide (TPR) repeat protein
MSFGMKLLVGKSRVLIFALLLCGAAAWAAPLGPADRASAGVLLAALAADPVAEAPLGELQAIYRRGPGLASLVGEFAERARRKPPAAADLIILGRLELARGRRVEGVHALALAVTPTTDPALARRVARLLDENGARADAIRAYRIGRANATATELRALELRLGVLLLADGKVAEARSLWAEAMRAAPADVALRRQVAEALASRGANREALAELKALEPLVSSEPAALVAVLRREAEFALRQNETAAAADALLRAYAAAAELRQTAIRGEIAAELVRAYKGKPGGLPQLVQIIKRNEAKSPQLSSLIGDVLAAGGDKKGAAAAYRAALQARPDDLYVLRREYIVETGDTRLQVLSRLFDLDRGDAQVGLELIAAMFAAKQVDEALVRASVLKARFADNALVLGDLATLLAANDQHALALAVAERGYKLDPDRVDGLIAYADELVAMKRPTDAAAVYFVLVEKDPSLNGYRHLVDLLTRRRLSDDVKRAYQTGLQRMPEAHALRRDYARLLASQGDLDGAVTQWKLVETGSKDVFLREYAAREIKRIETEKLVNH